MDRETRHQIKHDKFVDEVSHFYDDVRKNSQRVLMGVAVLIAIVGVVFAVITLGARQERKAQVRFAEALEILEAQSAATAEKYKTNAERVAAAEPILDEVIDKYSRTDAAQVAEIYKAQMELDRGETDKALARYEAFVKKNHGHILAGMAQMSIWELKLDKAPESVVPELEAAMNDPKSIVPKESVMMLLGEAYEKAGNTEKSQEMYRKVATEFPDSPYASEAQEKTSSS